MPRIRAATAFTKRYKTTRINARPPHVIWKFEPRYLIEPLCGCVGKRHEIDWKHREAPRGTIHDVTVIGVPERVTHSCQMALLLRTHGVLHPRPRLGSSSRQWAQSLFAFSQVPSASDSTTSLAHPSAFAVPPNAKLVKFSSWSSPRVSSHFRTSAD